MWFFFFVVFFFCRWRFKSVSLLKTHLPDEDVKGRWPTAQVPVGTACWFILNASGETLNCIFHLRAAGMMAPHSKLNQTCIASCKTQTAARRQHAPPPLSSYWPVPGVQPITCWQARLLLARRRVRHMSLRRYVGDVYQWVPWLSFYDCVILE